MRATKILLALCFVLLVKANDFELLSQMADYDFGKTIIETVQIELQQGSNSVDSIVTQLRQMKDASGSEITDS